MATQLRPSLDPTDTVYSVLIDSIEIGDRLRPIDAGWAHALGGIMRHEGQHTPIEICPNPAVASDREWKLVAGGHRLEGLKAHGQLYIKAIVVRAEAAELKMREVSENLHRRDLSPIDRAAFVAELHQLLRLRDGVDAAKAGRAISAEARWQKSAKADAADASVTVTLAYGWSDEVASRLGFSRETVFRNLLLHRRLSPAIAEQLRGHPIASNAGQLRALAKLPPGEQREVAAMILSGAVKNVSGGLAILHQKTPKTPEQKHQNAFLSAFQRMSRRDRIGALHELYNHAGFPLASADYQRWLADGQPELPPFMPREPE